MTSHLRTRRRTPTIKDILPILLLSHLCVLLLTLVKEIGATNCQYAQGFVIIVSDNNSTSSTAPLCYTFTNGSNTGSGDTVTLQGQHPTFTCEQPLTGRYVTIRRQGGYQPKLMSFCDVQVNGVVIDPVDRAHAQPATQSATTYGVSFASYAVDGDTTTCSITDTHSGSTYPWWQVDLQDQYTINYVTVLASTDAYNAGYLTGGFVVEVSDSNKTDSFLPSELCISYNVSYVPAGALLNLTCTQPVVGRYVTIKRNGIILTNNALTLCEVQIIGQYTAPPMASTLPMATTMNPTSVNNSLMYSTPQCSCPSSPSIVNSAAIIVGVVLGAILVAALILNILLILKIRNMKNNSAVVARRNDITKTDEKHPNYITLDPASRSEETTAPYEELRI